MKDGNNFATEAFGQSIRTIADDALKALSWKENDEGFSYSSEDSLVQAILKDVGHNSILDWWRLKFMQEALILLATRGPNPDGDLMPHHASRNGLADWLAADPARFSCK